MSFAEDAESLRAKAHMSGARLPVLVGLTALALAVIAIAGGGVAKTLSSEGFSVSKGEVAQEAAGAEGSQESEPPQEAATVVVHVGGAVREPGVREVPEGSRVQDAVDAAGGFAEGAAADALNLARVLVDGEQVMVPTVEELQAPPQPQADSGGSASSGSAGTGGGKVNINTASAEELDVLPGVGPSTAAKIVADREANGPFSTIEDLKRVSGIGDKKYAELADSICVG